MLACGLPVSLDGASLLEVVGILIDPHSQGRSAANLLGRAEELIHPLMRQPKHLSSIAT